MLYTLPFRLRLAVLALAGVIGFAVALQPPQGLHAHPAWAAQSKKATPKKTDPYKKYFYRVRFGAGDVAGFGSVSGYFGVPGTRIVNLDGGESRSLDFETWAASPSTRRNVDVVLVDSSGHPSSVTQYTLCWPRGYEASAAPGKARNLVLVSHLRLECAIPAPVQSATPRPY
jgi:hypothetical protein